MKKNMLFLFCVVLMFCGCINANAGEITVSWTAPGDDDMAGIADHYSFKFSSDSTEIINNFDNCSNCSIVINAPVPAIAGTCQSFIVGNLPVSETFYLAVKTVDEAGNWSELSNILKIFIPDLTSPARIEDLRFGSCE